MSGVWQLIWECTYRSISSQYTTCDTKASHIELDDPLLNTIKIWGGRKKKEVANVRSSNSITGT